MTYFHYYATTSRNLDRVLQYGVFPLSKALGLGLFSKLGSPANRIRYASDFARVFSAATYGALTTAFLGAEANMIDENSRKAVSAEMGIDPQNLQFSDYKYSQNVIVRKAHQDIMRLQKYRYGTDALFMLPIALRFASKVFGTPWLEHSREVNDKIRKGEKIGFGQLMLNGHNAWDFSVLAGKAGYWAGETYFVEKSGHYEIVKLIENLNSTGKDLSANDLLGVYQRSRMVDRGLPMLESAEEYDAIRPLLKHMADAYNRHNPNFGIAEVVYLIGLGKINIHDRDQKTVSHQAVQRSMKEIDKVIGMGLDGIREENRKLRETWDILESPAKYHEKTFTDRFGNMAVGAAQRFSKTISKALFGSQSRRHEERISVRDPGELAHWDRGVNR